MPQHNTREPGVGRAPLLLAETTGFEPAISGLTGQCARPLHHVSERVKLNLP